MNAGRSMIGFMLAVVAGTVASIAVTLVANMPPADEIIAVIKTFLPGIFMTVLISSTIFGLPVTRLLQRQQLEYFGLYTGIGTSIGFVIMFFPMVFISGMSHGGESSFWIMIAGAIGGGTTASTWWLLERRGQAAQNL